MIKVSGLNLYNNLIAKSNNQTSFAYNYPIIYPSVDLPNDSYLSVSFCNKTTSIITKDGLFKVYGKNFSGSKTVTIKDMSNKIYYPISAVSGNYYTLVLVSTTSPATDTSRYLALYENTNNNMRRCPKIFNTAYHPIAIFCCYYYSAAIDTEGGVTFLYYWDNDPSPPRAVLPGGDRAVMVSCCNEHFFILGSSGHVYRSKWDSPTNFALMSEISGIKIKQISGINHHCLAISDDGRVFAIGDNSNGENGIGKKYESSVDTFSLIEMLKPYKIVTASAGNGHSLFITEGGMVLSCGQNFANQLLLDSSPQKDIVTIHTETTVKSGASFCIAASESSIIFFGEVPPNTPNRLICIAGHNLQTWQQSVKKDENKKTTENLVN